MRRDTVKTAIRWRMKSRAARGGVLPTDNEATLERYEGYRAMLEYARSILTMAHGLLVTLQSDHEA